MENEARIGNRASIRTILTVVVVYILLTSLTAGLILIIAAVTWIISHILLRGEIAKLEGDAHHFRKNFPFGAYGTEIGDFEHVFFHNDELSGELLKQMGEALSRNFGDVALTPVELVDTDRNLKEPDVRSFHIAEITRTARATQITLAVRMETRGPTQAVRWWVMLGGFVDKNKWLTFLAFSPVTFWFWIVPYIRRQYNLASQVRTVYSAAYNDMDVLTLVRAGHRTVFDVLVNVLDKNGIDTSDLQVQRAQVMNINISGGKVNLGNVVQGAMNRVSAKVGGTAK